MTDEQVKALRATRLLIRNVVGIEELDIDLSTGSTLVEGANGTGKSSVLAALKAVLEGGHDATLIRKGADEGEAVLVLDDGMELRRRITANKSQLTVRHPEFGTVSAGQTYVNGIHDVLARNPVAFITDDGPGRVRTVLEAVPAETDREAITEAVDGLVEVPAELPGHGLTALDVVRKVLYDERTGVNRLHKDAKDTADKLESSLPDVPSDPEALTAAREALERESTAWDDTRDRIAKARDVMVAEFEQHRDAEIKRLEAAIVQAREVAAQNIRTTEGEAARDLEEVAGKRAQAVGPMEREVGRLEEQAKASARVDGLRARMVEFREKEAKAKAEADALTEGMGRLDALRATLVDQLPAGLEVRDGEVWRDGIPFPRLNTAQQVEVAVTVAGQRLGKLPIMSVDGCEALDRDAFGFLVRILDERGIQAVLARVVDGEPLTISNLDGATPTD